MTFFFNPLRPQQVFLPWLQKSSYSRAPNAISRTQWMYPAGCRVLGHAPKALFPWGSVGFPRHSWTFFFFNLIFLAGRSRATAKGEVTAAAVCATCTVPARGHQTLELALAWDMPRVHFGSKEKLHLRWVAWGQLLGWPGSLGRPLG